MYHLHRRSDVVILFIAVPQNKKYMLLLSPVLPLVFNKLSWFCFVLRNFLMCYNYSSNNKFVFVFL